MGVSESLFSKKLIFVGKAMNNSFMVGQRVIIFDNHSKKEIGTVVLPPRDWKKNEGCVWVYSPTREHELYFDIKNVEPLPNGQL